MVDSVFSSRALDCVVFEVLCVCGRSANSCIEKIIPYDAVPSPSHCASPSGKIWATLLPFAMCLALMPVVQRARNVDSFK